MYIQNNICTYKIIYVHTYKIIYIIVSHKIDTVHEFSIYFHGS